MQLIFRAFILCVGMSQAGYALASLSIPLYRLNGAPQGPGTFLGTVTVNNTTHGLLLTPHLKALPPGIHGFHLHEKADCGKAGQAAGGHWDPKHTQQHLGPYAAGHQGDLPALTVTEDGMAILPVLAPRLRLADLAGHSVIIHAKGDNYADKPAALGGGGGRIACGVVKESR